MLEIRKTAVSFDERDLMELERIVTDSDFSVYTTHYGSFFALLIHAWLEELWEQKAIFSPRLMFCDCIEHQLNQLSCTPTYMKIVKDFLMV